MIVASKSKPKILIVDDVCENIHAMMNALRDDYAIIAATDGEKALQLANQEPDLILLDIKMPDMDGYEILRRLKADPATANIPVIFVTALSDTADEAKGLKLGAVDYITKPINPDLLKLRIMTQLELLHYHQKIAAIRAAHNGGSKIQSCILIVDDVPENIHGLISSLSDEYRILVANNGARAIEIVQSQPPPDLVLLDILMPEMDGYEVCRAIKSMPEGEGLPVLFLSVLDDSVDKVLGFSIGAADYIAKPFDIDEVRARVRTHLELSRYRNHLEVMIEKATIEIESKNSELQKLSRAVEQSPNSIFITDLNAHIEYVNDAFTTHTGYSREEVVGQTPEIFKSGKIPQSTYDELKAALANGQSWRGELINRRKDNSEIIESTTIAPIRQADGTISHFIAIEQDITPIRQAEDTIHRLTNFDYLTGLPNKNLLLERLDFALIFAQRQAQFGATIILNIDRFKTLIEGHGHALGDACLIALGNRIAELLSAEDTLARLSSDEFAIILCKLGKQRELANQRVVSTLGEILDNLRAPFIFSEDQEISLSVRLGVALFPEGEQDSTSEILRRADTAMYRAKETESPRIAFFDTAMTDYAEQRFRIERELRRGIASGELRLFLQPQVNPAGHHVGAEALVRWQHPEQGLVPPIVFIPVAEESDLIVDLGIWVMNEACRLIAQEAQLGVSLNLSVNISPRHFRQPEFVCWLKELLAKTGVNPGNLTLEITENCLIKNMDDAVTKMTELRVLGIHFSIDDFGTGYSSLAYLKHLPIQELKIDKTFIQDSPDDVDDAMLVEIILAVAKHMQLRVVAEGVETEAQAAFLNARGEVIHQGYLYGKPEDAQIWIERWREMAVG